MRIALICPDMVNAESTDSLAVLAERLAHDLRLRHVEATCFETDAIGAVQAFEQATSFDVLHNLVGARVLTYSSLVDAPLLTTLGAAPTDEEMSILRRYEGRANLVVSHDEHRHPDLTYLATIVPGESLADDYIAVYRELLSRRENYRPWGHYLILEDHPLHKVKRIVVSPGQRLSYQKHERRAEHWMVVHGQAIVTLDGHDIELGAGEAVDIPRGAAHRVRNPGEVALEFIEVQTGDYFGEDDIIRMEDDYGRS